MEDNNNEVVGYCKECTGEIFKHDKIADRGIYECGYCGYPSGPDDIITEDDLLEEDESLFEELEELDEDDYGFGDESFKNDLGDFDEILDF